MSCMPYVVGGLGDAQPRRHGACSAAIDRVRPIDAHPGALAPSPHRARSRDTLEQPHQLGHLAARPIPVLDRESVERQDLDAVDRGRHASLAHGLDAFAMARVALESTCRLGPATVAVHDDGDVSRDSIGLNFGFVIGSRPRERPFPSGPSARRSSSRTRRSRPGPSSRHDAGRPWRARHPQGSFSSPSANPGDASRTRIR